MGPALQIKMMLRSIIFLEGGMYKEGEEESFAQCTLVGEEGDYC